MLQAITTLLNGPYAGTAMLLLRILFFAVFVLAALWLTLAGQAGGGARGRGFPLLAFVTVVALLALLAYQGSWQLAGFRRVEFMRFMRSHNPRPISLVKRGAIVDCNGTLLAIDDPLPGDPWRRRYPLGAAAAHAVGYFDPRLGMAGLEQAADLALSGAGGGSLRELNQLGRNLLDHRQAAGNDLHVTLDARLQRKAWELMRDRQGAVVVLRPSDGAIKVLLSMPAFDPTVPGESSADHDRAPMLNRALQGRYPPGSTFKIIMAALAAESGRAPLFDCPAEGFRAARDASPIRDSEYYLYAREGRVWPGRGRTGLRAGFVHSSNVYFAQLGLAAPPPAFNAIVTRAQLNARVPLFQGESGELAAVAGEVPRVTEGDRRARAQLAIGQGRMLATPLHVALWTAAIAAGGELHAPRLDASAPVQSLGRLTTVPAAAAVRDMMREAVTSGTGHGADLAGLEVCGKTGTAQAPGGDDHAWFTCFAPLRQPRLVVTVLVERGGYGSRSAVPVARALLEEADRLGLVRGAGR